MEILNIEQTREKGHFRIISILLSLNIILCQRRRIQQMFSPCSNDIQCPFIFWSWFCGFKLSIDIFMFLDKTRTFKYSSMSKDLELTKIINLWKTFDLSGRIRTYDLLCRKKKSPSDPACFVKLFVAERSIKQRSIMLLNLVHFKNFSRGRSAQFLIRDVNKTISQELMDFTCS